MAIKRSDIVRRPVLPERAVQADSFNGEVIVRGMGLTDRIAFFAMAADGMEDSERAQSFDDYKKITARISHVLAVCVLDDERKPLLSVEEWEAHAIDGASDCMNLYREALALSGIGKDAPK